MSLPPIEIPLGAMRFNSASNRLEYWNGSIWMQIHTFSPNLAQSGESAVGARAIIHMGYGPSNKNTINALNLATGGTALDFGNSTVTARQQSSLANRIRALRGGGYSSSYLDTIDFVTIASAGDAQDFGNLTQDRGGSFGGLASDTRGVFAGGMKNDNTRYNVIDYITIASTGNAVDFGDTRTTTSQSAGCSDCHGGLE